MSSAEPRQVRRNSSLGTDLLDELYKLLSYVPRFPFLVVPQQFLQRAMVRIKGVRPCRIIKGVMCLDYWTGLHANAFCILCSAVSE